MKYLSVCSGIEAATVAWHQLGWEPVGFSEIEPFPSAVLAHHYPGVPNLGDMTRFKEWNIGRQSIDLLVGGTPCQAFSVAGLRGGLSDARGNLSLTFCEMADHFDPEWVLWENVPGVLSSKDNAFGCFLAGLSGAGEPLVSERGWDNAGLVVGPKRTVAWRICDAQYHGVAQRRRRVFVLAVRGAGNWASAAALFPVCDGVHWDTAPSRPSRKGTARGAARGAEGGGQQPYDVANCLTQRMHKGINSTVDEGQTPVLAQPVAGTLGNRGLRSHTELDGHGAYIPVAIQGTLIGRSENAGPQGSGADVSGAMFTLTKTDVHAVAFAQNTRDEVRLVNGDGQIVGALAAEPGMKQTSYVAFGVGEQPDVGHCLRSGASKADKHESTTYVAQPVAWDEELNARTDLAGAMLRGGDGGRHDGVMTTAMQVRRLTPTECERLQGFPDGYTAIPWRNKPADECPDGPRYKALGNSMAVPVMRWIGERIAKTYKM